MISTADVNAFVLKRQKDVMVVGEPDDRRERKYSNGEINPELTTLKRICPWVFNRSNRKVKGKRITTCVKAFRAACTKAGCPGRIPHDLRRTAVRNLVRAGVPERVAMQMTGHKTRSVFERYNIVNECDLLEAARKLNAIQPASVTPDGGSHASDRDGHNLGTVGPDRGSRLGVSL
jgi:integrase